MDADLLINCAINGIIQITKSMKDEGDRAINFEDYITTTKEKIEVGGQLCKFKAYSPYIFERIRKDILNIDSKSYLKSWKKSKSSLLRESAGRSGSLFYKTEDKKYMFKTIQYTEVDVMRSILRDYHDYLQANRKSFIMKVLGLYRIQQGFSKIWILVFKNSLPHNVRIDFELDLKGRKPKPGKSHSERGRKTSEDNPIKDNELNRGLFFLNSDEQQFYCNQIKLDTEFLSSHNLMDYSLLVGVHVLTSDSTEESDVDSDNRYSDSTSSQDTKKKKARHTSTEKLKKKSRHSSSEKSDDSTRKSKKNGNYTKKSKLRHTSSERTIKSESKQYTERELRKLGGLLGKNCITNEKEVYFIAIIDCLTSYVFKKRLANMFKTFVWDEATLSTVESKYYAFRFHKFMTTNLITEGEVSYDNIGFDDWESSESSSEQMEVTDTRIKYNTLNGDKKKQPRKREVVGSKEV